MILTEDMTSRSLLSHLLLMVVLGDGGKRLRRRRSAWALHDCCLCLLPALVTILITLSLPSFTLAGSICLEKCDCFYTRNKLIAGCGAKGLTDIPEESPDDAAKSTRSSIQILNLTRNTFSELKANIFLNAKMVNLQRIYLQQVGLERIDKLSFAPLQNLVELDLSLNALKSIPTEAFEPMPKLSQLDLSSNKIESVPSFSFHSLKVLRTLSLERNHITFIDVNSFVGLDNLETLKISDNRLRFLDSRSLAPLPKVHSLTLGGNKWDCDCRLRQLREFFLMNPNKYSVSDEPKCSIGNKVWTQLDLNSFLCSPRIVPNNSASAFQVEEFKKVSLQCSFYMDEGLEPQYLPVKWLWQDRPIGNNSEGVVPNQVFMISEFEAPLFGNSSTKKMKVSRLEISLVLELNQGVYSCQSQNKAGSAQWNFSISVTKQKSAAGGVAGVGVAPNAEHASIVTGSEGTPRGHGSRTPTDSAAADGGSASAKGPAAPESVVAGLVLGILFGVFLVLLVFALVVIVVCRRRRTRRRSSGATDRVAAESELEKLAPSTLCNSISSRETVALINPVQKPPRLGFAGTPTTPTATPQVWLIKRNNGANGNTGSARSDGDGCCETPLSLFEYDTATISTLTTVGSTMEPDLIHHPAAYIRNRLICNEEQISIHSDGTEV